MKRQRFTVFFLVGVPISFMLGTIIGRGTASRNRLPDETARRTPSSDETSRAHPRSDASVRNAFERPNQQQADGVKRLREELMSLGLKPRHEEQSSSNADQVVHFGQDPAFEDELGRIVRFPGLTPEQREIAQGIFEKFSTAIDEMEQRYKKAKTSFLERKLACGEYLHPQDYAIVTTLAGDRILILTAEDQQFKYWNQKRDQLVRSRMDVEQRFLEANAHKRSADKDE